MSMFFKVLGIYKGIQEDGSEGQCKETFLIEADNFADAYFTALELLNETANEPDSVDISKVERMDKLSSIFYSDIMNKDNSVKKGMIELSFPDEDKAIYSIKVVFSYEVNGKMKKSSDIYFVPAENTTKAIKHVKAHLRGTMLDYKISDTKPTTIQTVVLSFGKCEELVAEYDNLKTYIK